MHNSPAYRRKKEKKDNGFFLPVTFTTSLC